MPPIGVLIPAVPSGPRAGPASAVRRLAQVGLVALGVLTIVAGFLIAPLPGPMGLPLATLGLMIVLRNSYTARRGFVRMNRRHPKWVSPFRTLLRPHAKVAPSFYRLALRLERLALRGRFSLLGALHRRLRRGKARPAV